MGRFDSDSSIARREDIRPGAWRPAASFHSFCFLMPSGSLRGLHESPIHDKAQA